MKKISCWRNSWTLHNKNYFQKHKNLVPKQLFIQAVWVLRKTSSSENILFLCFRSDITIVCKGMQFSRYPLDTHSCMFKLSSCKFKQSSCFLLQGSWLLFFHISLIPFVNAKYFARRKSRHNFRNGFLQCVLWKHIIVIGLCMAYVSSMVSYNWYWAIIILVQELSPSLL